MYEGERFGPYVLREKIAQGGMAEIFFGERRGAMDFRREVCIKRIRPNLSGDPTFVEMFIDEARICSRLRHSNIVAIDDFGSTDGQLYICMEWVHGTDVGHLLKRLAAEGRRMPIDAALFVLSEVLRGLEYAHGKHDHGVALNIVHRDVTPHNVLISYAGEVKLSDFGIARATSRLHQTQGDLVKGKLPYMAPEQATGKTLDGRTDLFALGICAFELLAGQRPFPGKDRDVIHSMLRGERPALRTLRPEVPPGVERWIDTLLQLPMDQRFPSAAAALDAMQAIPFPTGGRSLTALLSEFYPDQASVLTPAIVPAPAPVALEPTRPQHLSERDPAGTEVVSLTTDPMDSTDETEITPPAVFGDQPRPISPTQSSIPFAATAPNTPSPSAPRSPPPRMRRLTLGVLAVAVALLGITVALATRSPSTPPIAHPQPPAAHLQPPAAHLQPPAAHLQPPAAHPQPPAAHLQPPAAHLQPPTETEAAPTFATLTVTVQPWGSATLDGQPLAVGRAVRVATGTHTVAASQPGGRNTSRRVTLTTGESARVRLEIPR